MLGKKKNRLPKTKFLTTWEASRNLNKNTTFFFSFPGKPIKHKEIHANINFIFFSKAFSVPKQKLNNNNKKTQIPR